MVVTYCDYCKRKIESSNEQVNLNFNAFDITGFLTDTEYNFHVECATRVRNKIEAFLSESVRKDDTNAEVD